MTDNSHRAHIKSWPARWGILWRAVCPRCDWKSIACEDREAAKEEAARHRMTTWFSPGGSA